MQVVQDPLFGEFRSAMIDTLHRHVRSPTYRGGFYPIVQTNMLLGALAESGFGVQGRRVIDLGCGSTRPLTTSILLYLAGAADTLAIDFEEPFDWPAIAVAEYANIVAILSGRSGFDQAAARVTAGAVARRAAEFDLAALLEGDIAAGLPRQIRHRLSRYQDLPAPEREFSLMISNSVFEHVTDLDDLLVCARRHVAEDGLVFVSVDYRDHRLYAAGASPWQYLLDDGDHEPGYINKVRHSEMVAKIEAAGFRILSCTPRSEPLPVEIESGMLPRFRSISKADLETVEASILFAPAPSRSSSRLRWRNPFRQRG